MVNKKNTEWTQEEIEDALPVLAKIKFCFQNVPPEDYPLPPDVYNAWTGAVKLSAIEFAILRDKKIYLIRRPSLEEFPQESWPNHLHIPGCTMVPCETSQKAIQRLIAQELGGVELRKIKLVGVVDYDPPPRSMVTTLLYIVKVVGEPKNPKGEFYPIKWALESNELTSFHREIVIPRALDSLLWPRIKKFFSKFWPF